MIRYQIKMRRCASILDVGGMAERVVAPSGTRAEIVVYVCRENKEKFEKLIGAQPDVLDYFSHPANSATKAKV